MSKKITTPATVGKFNPNGIEVDPQSTPVKAYTATAKPFSGDNKATVGKLPQKYAKGLLNIDPQVTMPCCYTKTVN